MGLWNGIPYIIAYPVVKIVIYPWVHLSVYPADGLFLIEVNRVLKPGGYFVLTSPTTRRQERSLRLKKRYVLTPLEELTQQLCWTLLAHQDETYIWQKTADVDCYTSR